MSAITRSEAHGYKTQFPRALILAFISISIQAFLARNLFPIKKGMKRPFDFDADKVRAFYEALNHKEDTRFIVDFCQNRGEKYKENPRNKIKERTRGRFAESNRITSEICDIDSGGVLVMRPPNKWDFYTISSANEQNPIRRSRLQPRRLIKVRLPLHAHGHSFHT